MPVDPTILVANIFTASLVMAGLEVPLIGIYYGLWFQTGGERRYKHAIRISVVAAFWFLVVAMIALGLLTFTEIGPPAPAALFVLLLVGAILIGLTVISAAGWKIVESFPAPPKVEPFKPPPPP